MLKLLTNGELIEIETPETRLAAKYKEIHDRLRCNIRKNVYLKIVYNKIYIF